MKTTTNNTMNDQFNININMFLNETCKDAINLSDFIERIEISHDDSVREQRTVRVCRTVANSKQQSFFYLKI